VTGLLAAAAAAAVPSAGVPSAGLRRPSAAAAGAVWAEPPGPDKGCCCC
jgi:hypothetical protein